MKSTTLPMNLASVAALAVLALAGCSQPPEPTLGCQSDSDCNTGYICKVGRCVVIGSVICSATADCDTALANGSWKPSEAGVCLATACNEQICEMVARSAGTACDDDDGLACTQGACDDAGACQAGASIAANTCVIDNGGTKSCVDADTNNPANGCQACIPDIDAKGWTDKPMGAGCDDADGLSCTHGTCNGGGECNPAGIDTGACVIDQKCVKQGETRDGSAGCQVCEPTSSQSQWTSLPEAATCSEDGAECRPGKCASGSCVIEGVSAGFCFIAGDGGKGACIADGTTNPSAPCERCVATVVQDKWSPIAAGTACKADDIACTQDACDGQGGCIATPDDGACKDKDGPCVRGACDAADVKGCKTVPLPTTATCTGDAFDCTVEYCDGQGACSPKQNPDDTACNDGLTCTVDSCDPTAGTVNSGCVHKQVDAACDDGNLCTADTCAGANGEAGSGCTYIPNAADCTTDGLACTTEQCKDGACKLTVDAKNCVIDGACVAEGTKQQQGCQSCTPSASQSAWTLASAGATCDDDGASCTKDTCSAAGACKHETIAGACDDGLPCTVDACDPGTAWADSKTGCAFVDDCPYGHSCDATAKVCLTPEPVVLVPASADDPAPTNPVALRHVLDAKTSRHRLWVVYQSQAAATAKQVSLGGTPEKFETVWQINQASRLRAVVLDPAVAAKPGDAKPKPKTVTFANTVTGINAAAAFPAVAADPESSSQGWLTWLEAGVGNTPVCLDNFGRGGIARLARLDGAAVPANGTWSAVAGTTCPLDGGDKPGFLTPGFAVLGGAQTDPAKRGVVLARPKVDDLKSPFGNILSYGGVLGSSAATGGTLLGSFSTVAPRVVDTGAEDGNKARFWVLALGEKEKSGSYTRELWALPLDAKGIDDTPTSWLASGASGVGATVLGGATAVCTLDAAWDADKGEAVVAIVTRQAGKDKVWLARGKPGGTFTAVEVASKTSKGDCRQGIAGAKVTVRSGSAIVSWFEALLPSVPTAGMVYAADVSGAKVTSLTKMPTEEAATSDSGSGAAPANALATRGLAGVVDNGTTVSAIIEATVAGKRQIILHTFIP